MKLSFQQTDDIITLFIIIMTLAALIILYKVIRHKINPEIIIQIPDVHYNSFAVFVDINGHIGFFVNTYGGLYLPGICNIEDKSYLTLNNMPTDIELDKINFILKHDYNYDNQSKDCKLYAASILNVIEIHIDHTFHIVHYEPSYILANHKEFKGLIPANQYGLLIELCHSMHHNKQLFESCDATTLLSNQIN